jgi:hypothetical protein
MFRRYLTTCILFAACSAQDTSHRSTPQGPTGGKGDNGTQACIDPNADCNGNADCEKCKNDPSPCKFGAEWYAGMNECVCAGDPNALGCQVGECCPDGELWDYTQCTCLPADSFVNAPPTGPAVPACLTKEGIDCGNDQQCAICTYVAECGSGPDPVYYNGQCYCLDGGSGCDIGYCCPSGQTWDKTQCDCVPAT